MGFSRQEYWSGLPFPSLGDLPDSRIEPWSPALQADSLLTEPPGKLSLEGEPQHKDKITEWRRDPNPAWGVDGDVSNVGHQA